MVLETEIPDLDYEPVKGLGTDRDIASDAMKLVTLIRQLGRCAYCCAPLQISIMGGDRKFSMYRNVSKRLGEFDHGIPVSQGGRDSYLNVGYLCQYHNGFKFKAGNIELHGAILAARLGQTTDHDWTAMLDAFNAGLKNGRIIYALPFWWFEPGRIPLKLAIPGYDGKDIDGRASFSTELAWFNRNIEEFMGAEGFTAVKRMILPELERHRQAYQF